jgi:hypothetical protein
MIIPLFESAQSFTPEQITNMMPEIEAVYQLEDKRLDAETAGEGHPFTICTNSAKFIRNKFFSGQKIVGYDADDNPTAEIGQDCGGHDFILVDDRYIIDMWYKYVEGEDVPTMIDTEVDTELTQTLYGDRSKWVDTKI